MPQHKATDWVPAFLKYMDDTWKPAGGIAVTEFGFAEPFEQDKQLLGDIRFDLARSAYYHDYMQAILIAISEGVNVVGALAWSIVDNLEWVSRAPPWFNHLRAMLISGIVSRISSQIWSSIRQLDDAREVVQEQYFYFY